MSFGRTTPSARQSTCGFVGLRHQRDKPRVVFVGPRRQRDKPRVVLSDHAVSVTNHVWFCRTTPSARQTTCGFVGPRHQRDKPRVVLSDHAISATNDTSFGRTTPSARQTTCGFVGPRRDRDNRHIVWTNGATSATNGAWFCRTVPSSRQTTCRLDTPCHHRDKRRVVWTVGATRGRLLESRRTTGLRSPQLTLRSQLCTEPERDLGVLTFLLRGLSDPSLRSPDDRRTGPPPRYRTSRLRAPSAPSRAMGPRCAPGGRRMS